MRKIIPSLPVLMTTTLNGIMCWGINQLPGKSDLGVPSEIIIGLTICSVLGIVFFSSQPSESQKNAETTSVTSMWMLGLLPAMGSIILFILIKDGHVPSEFNKAAGYTSLFLFIAGTLLPAVIAFWKIQQPIIVTSIFGSVEEKREALRNARKNVLKVMSTEVQARLSQSIHRAAFVNLGKEQQPQQVQRPWDMSVKVGEQRSVQLPPQTTILDVFDNPTISGKFLILGKPGGGKTTTLLELAEALIERADGNSNAPIPVILELSSWQEVTKPKFLPFGEREKYDPSIQEWILSQLGSKGVSQDIGEQWLREKELVLLLDGLDELQPERQAKCVRAINQFLGGEFSPLHLVVCSRKEEYEVYEEILHLNGAICLEDLTNEQIRDYFTSVNLGEFWESIKGSEKIVDFIRQPLFLAVTSIAYQQVDVEEWRNCNTEERAIDYLLGVYRIQVLDSKTQNSYVSPILKALAKTIDTSMGFTFQDVDPLPFLQKFNKGASWYFFITILDLPFLYFLGEFSWRAAASSTPWHNLSISGVEAIFNSSSILLKFIFLFVSTLGIIGIFFAFYFPCLPFYNVLWIEVFRNTFWINDQFIQQTKKLGNKNPISHLVKITIISPSMITVKGVLNSAFEMRHQNLNDIASTLIRLLLPMLLLLIFFLFFLLMWLIPLIYFALIFIFSTIPLILIAWLHFFVLIKIIDNHKTISKSKVLTSAIITFVMTVIGFLLSFLYFASIYTINSDFLYFASIMTNIEESEKSILKVSLYLALYYGIIWAGGSDLIKYCGFRLILGFSGIMPWNITRFLDYCTERLILQRVGNRYRFIHRLVQEHFAKLEIQKE